MSKETLKIGIDLGGTKISAVALNSENCVTRQIRIPSPQGSYDETLNALGNIVRDMESSLEQQATIGIGIPGSISRKTGLVQNANSTWLIGKPLQKDLMKLLDREIRFANDADCFALSEATDGAAAGADIVFGAIIGTGCGGSIVVNRQIISGPKGISGEWGHTPLPWIAASELNVTECWCGLSGCLETWISGTAMAADHLRLTGQKISAKEIGELAETGDTEARNTLDRYISRLARGLAAIVNILDPDVIVLGGGVSNVSTLYEKVPEAMSPYIFSDNREVVIKPPKYGDDSGVRGAAWLWNS